MGAFRLLGIGGTHTTHMLGMCQTHNFVGLSRLRICTLNLHERNTECVYKVYDSTIQGISQGRSTLDVSISGLVHCLTRRSVKIGHDHGERSFCRKYHIV